MNATLRERDRIAEEHVRTAEENLLDNEFWAGISLGGPVEPTYPTNEPNGVIIVGKAPGTAEVAHAAPFTGPSGRLLDKMLDRAGIDRSATLLTNVFRMQPAWTTNAEGKRNNNDVSLFFTPDITEANTKIPPLNDLYVKNGPDEHVRDLWRLVRQTRPKLIIGLGQIAAWGLTGNETLRDRSGIPLFDNEINRKHGNAPIFLTSHPALAQHKNSEAIALQIAADIKTAYEWLTSSTPASHPPGKTP